MSIGCRQDWSDVHLLAGLSLQRVQLAALYAVHLLAGIALVVFLRRSQFATGPAAFLQSVALYAAIAAVFSTAFTFAGTLMLTPC